MPSPVTVWTRAVVVPAWRRVAAVWFGTAIVGGLIFGPTAMHPGDLTGLALGVPAIGIGLALVWVLVFLPSARILVRADEARYLRSLPIPRWGPVVVGAGAFLALQLPWLALWTIGDGWRGLAIVVALSAMIAALAAWRRAPRPVVMPRWRRDHEALRGLYLRALRRRASDACVRGVGFAILAGLVGALVVRNNEVVGREAAVLGTCVIVIVLIPGCSSCSTSRTTDSTFVDSTHSWRSSSHIVQPGMQRSLPPTTPRSSKPSARASFRSCSALVQDARKPDLRAS